MSEMVLVLGVMALTVAVLLWILVVSRKWLKMRDQLMSLNDVATPSGDLRPQALVIRAGARRVAEHRTVPERRNELHRVAA